MLKEVRGSTHSNSSLEAKESCSRLLGHAGASRWDPGRGSGVCRRCSEVCVCKNSSPGSGRAPAWINKTAILVLMSSSIKHLPTSTNTVFTGPSYSQSSVFQLSLNSRTGWNSTRNLFASFHPSQKMPPLTEQPQQYLHEKHGYESDELFYSRNPSFILFSCYTQRDSWKGTSWGEFSSGLSGVKKAQPKDIFT